MTPSAATGADTALPATEDAARGAAFGATGQDEAATAAYTRGANFDIAIFAAQVPGRAGAVVDEEAVLTAAGGTAAVGGGAGLGLDRNGEDSEEEG